MQASAAHILKAPMRVVVKCVSKNSFAIHDMTVDEMNSKTTLLSQLALFARQRTTPSKKNKLRYSCLESAETVSIKASVRSGMLDLCVPLSPFFGPNTEA